MKPILFIATAFLLTAAVRSPKVILDEIQKDVKELNDQGFTVEFYKGSITISKTVSPFQNK